MTPPSEQAPPPATLAERTDAELLACMSRSAGAPEAARAAWEAFYLRHVEYLHAVCLRAWGPLLGGPAGAADLTAETFRRAYERAGTFSAEEPLDSDRQRLRVRAWLGRIAQRLAQAVLRGQAHLAARHLDGEQWHQVAGQAQGAKAEQTAPVEAGEVALVREAIAALSEKEQLVIRATFQWYRPEAPHQRLPNAVAAELAATLGTTPENLRQIRRRALRKIKTHLERPGVAAQRRSKP